MKTYRILSTIRYKGKDLKSGHVVLEDEMAVELLASGHIMGPIAVHDSAGKSSGAVKTTEAVDDAELKETPTTKPTRASKK